jgi:hypothetical protein
MAIDEVFNCDSTGLEALWTRANWWLVSMSLCPLDLTENYVWVDIARSGNENGYCIEFNHDGSQRRVCSAGGAWDPRPLCTEFGPWRLTDGHQCEGLDRDSSKGGQVMATSKLVVGQHVTLTSVSYLSLGTVAKITPEDTEVNIDCWGGKTLHFDCNGESRLCDGTADYGPWIIVDICPHNEPDPDGYGYCLRCCTVIPREASLFGRAC